jgi:hypothetical protein
VPRLIQLGLVTQSPGPQGAPLLQPVPLNQAVAALQEHWLKRHQQHLLHKRPTEPAAAAGDGYDDIGSGSSGLQTEDGAAARAAVLKGIEGQAQTSASGLEGYDSYQQQGDLLLAGEASLLGTAANRQLQLLVGDAAEDDVWEWVQEQEKRALEDMRVRDETGGSGVTSHPLWRNGGGGEVGDAGEGPRAAGAKVETADRGAGPRVVARGLGMGGRHRYAAAAVMPVPSAASGAEAACGSTAMEASVVRHGENRGVRHRRCAQIEVAYGEGIECRITPVGAAWNEGVASRGSSWSCVTGSSCSGRMEHVEEVNYSKRPLTPTNAPAARSTRGGGADDDRLGRVVGHGHRGLSATGMGELAAIPAAGAVAAAGKRVLSGSSLCGSVGKVRRLPSSRAGALCTVHQIGMQRSKASLVGGCRRVV